MNTRRLRPSGNRQVTISFGKVYMNRGSLRLRTLTGRGRSLVFKAAVKPAVSLGRLGRSESGVFIWRTGLRHSCDRNQRGAPQTIPRLAWDNPRSEERRVGEE